jgi:hypothetical protein
VFGVDIFLGVMDNCIDQVSHCFERVLDLPRRIRTQIGLRKRLQLAVPNSLAAVPCSSLYMTSQLFVKVSDQMANPLLKLSWASFTADCMTLVASLETAPMDWMTFNVSCTRCNRVSIRSHWPARTPASLVSVGEI